MAGNVTCAGFWAKRCAHAFNVGETMHKKKLVQICCAAALAIAPLGALHATTSGSLQTSDGVYAFTPKSCGIYKDNDFYDIEMHGPGTSPGGEKVYVEFSSTADALSVKFGVDSVFASSDKGVQSDGQLKIHVDGSKIRAVEVKLIDQDRRVVDTNATLEIDCS